MRAALSCALLLALAAPVAAQNNDQTGGQAPTASEKCRAEPDQQGSQNQKKPENQNGNLTEKLDPCGGVLKPPPTGDTGIAEPPPDEGKTPVIKPGEIPAQPPKK